MRLKWQNMLFKSLYLSVCMHSHVWSVAACVPQHTCTDQRTTLVVSACLLPYFWDTAFLLFTVVFSRPADTQPSRNLPISTSQLAIKALGLQTQGTMSHFTWILGIQIGLLILNLPSPQHAFFIPHIRNTTTMSSQTAMSSCKFS